MHFSEIPVMFYAIFYYSSLCLSPWFSLRLYHFISLVKSFLSISANEFIEISPFSAFIALVVCSIKLITSHLFMRKLSFPLNCKPLDSSDYALPMGSAQ